VIVSTYGPGYEIVRESNPRTPYQGKFSLAYCVAAALLEGRVGLAQFGDDRFGPDGVVEPRIAALLPRLHVEVDPGLTARYPGAWPVRLRLDLTDGRNLSRAFDYPRGNPENPVPPAALQAKATDLIAPRYDASLAAQVVDGVARLDEVEDMAVFMRELIPSGA
jgi:2-methylcitrate dehydratase PrpD